MKIVAWLPRGNNRQGRRHRGIRSEKYPMIMEELVHHTDRVGAMIKYEATGRPWRARDFKEKWRELKRLVGIPDEVQNRDSHTGGITEDRKSGASLEDLRHHASHADTSR